MSVVSMQKMSLVAHKSDRGALLKLFARSGCVEVTSAPVCEGVAYSDDREMRNVLESKRLKVGFALSFLKDAFNYLGHYGKENKIKADFGKENRLVAFEEYGNVSDREEAIFADIARLEEMNSRLTDIKGERSKLFSLKEQLLPYVGLELPFSKIVNTAACALIYGTLPLKNVEAVKQKLPELCEMSVYGGDKNVCVAFCVHKSCEREFLLILSEYDFVRGTFDLDVTAAQRIFEADIRLTELEREKKEIYLGTADFLPFISELKVLYDNFTIEIAKCDALLISPETDSAFIMEGWVPKDRAPVLDKQIKEKLSHTEVFFRDPYDDETPPTLVKENRVVKPFQGLTEMFGLPGYRETDPNIFVAFFYFLIFGIMIGDAGYGLIMSLACFAYLKIKKPVKNSGMMIAMFMFCGISTLIWGALFGGWFSIEGLSGTFLGKLIIFEPLSEPLKMFMLALAVGAVQIGVGFAINGFIQIKKKNYVEGVLTNFGWVVIMTGLLMIFPAIMTFLNVVDESPAWFETCTNVGVYVLLIGVVAMLLGGAWGNKNPIKMVVGMFSSAYGSINVVSDLLSYSRLFGLGLTTGVIGLVVNQLATILVNQFFGGLWIGWIVAVPVLVFGHGFNLGINLLGAYVHDSRLQYIEFFGRFYEGGGHAFKPLAGEAKYTYPNN